MYVVTGGAGFIGSNIVARLCGTGEEIVVCDRMGRDQRWQNLSKHEITELIAPPALRAWLQRHGRAVTAVVHMGAISTTTETDVELLTENNIRSTLDLLDWCTESGTRLIYASSAATYGDGSAGFEDEFTRAALGLLRPLNAYGWSKHVMDRHIARLRELNRPLPPQCVGLKFFNVYGPNEYHKGSMRSLVSVGLPTIQEAKPLRLYRSNDPRYPDGGQRRDFVYVEDCVDVVVWLLHNPAVSGLFNVGTGVARTWEDLAGAMFAAAGKPLAIEYVDMPATLSDQYQNFTQASMSRLRSAGYHAPFTALEAGVGDYIKGYLTRKDIYR